MAKSSRRKTPKKPAKPAKQAKQAKRQPQSQPDPSLPLESTRVFRWRDRRDLLHISVVLAVAFGLRMVFYYLNQKNNPVFYHPIMDALYHHEWAEGILDGTVAADDVFFRGPLYPYLLAFLYKLGGMSVSFVVFAQHVIGTITAALVYMLAREYFSTRVSLLAGLFAALYWPFLYFEGDLLIVTTVLFLNTWGILLFARAIRQRSYLLLVATGLVFGLSAIARPSVLIFFPFLPLVLYWNRRRSEQGRGWVARGAVVVVAIVAVILPVMVRNYVVARTVVPVAASGGVNFYIGNNPASDGSTAIVPGTRADWWGGYYDAIEKAEMAEGRKLDLAGVSNYYFKRGLKWIVAYPEDATAHFFKKFRVFWSGPERANNKFIYFFWNLAGMKYVILPGFWLIAPLALFGGVLQWRRRRLLSPLYLFVLMYMIGVVVFFVNARFRLPVVPIMIVFAAYAVFYLVSVIRQKDLRAIRATVILAVAVVLVNIDYMSFAQVRAYSNAFSHSTLGNAYMKMNRRDTALDHYVQAWRLNEQSPTPAFTFIARDVTYNMGLLYWEKGLCSRAIEALRRVGPAPDGSPDSFTLNALNWLGDCYLRQSQYDNAGAVYQEFRRIKSDDARGVTGMARVLAATGNPEEAERILKSVVDPTTPVYVPAYVALAEVQRNLGKTREAIESYTAISQFLGFEKDAFLALAEMYQELGDFDAAIQALQNASRYFPPGDPTIQNWISRLRAGR